MYILMYMSCTSKQLLCTMQSSTSRVIVRKKKSNQRYGIKKSRIFVMSLTCIKGGAAAK